MWFELFLDLHNLKYYGDIPETPEDREGRVEIFEFDDKIYAPLFDEDFIDEVNNLCDTCLDLTDVDYFDKEKCVKLKSWLVQRLAKELNPLLKPIYEKMLDYSSRAIELETGVVIQL